MIFMSWGSPKIKMIVWTFFFFSLVTLAAPSAKRACAGCCQAVAAVRPNATVQLTCLSKEPPARFFLYQCDPKRFQTETKIKFDLPQTTHVRLHVADVVGRDVEVLVDSTLAAGAWLVTWNATSRPNGMYYYAIQAGQFKNSKEMWIKH